MSPLLFELLHGGYILDFVTKSHYSAVPTVAAEDSLLTEFVIYLGHRNFRYDPLGHILSEMSLNEMDADMTPVYVRMRQTHRAIGEADLTEYRDEIVRMLGSQELDLAIMGRPPAELKTVSTPFAKHPMAFMVAPTHALMQGTRGGKAKVVTMAQLSEQRILVRERGSGTRATIERLFKDAALPLRIGSEMSSNEAIKHMCAAGFGVAFLSMHTCVLEMEAGVLALLPMEHNPIERDWYVMHLASRQLPQVALAFERFLVERGQGEIRRQLAAKPAAKKTARRAKRTVRPSGR